MPWGDSGIYGGCSRGLKPRIFAPNCRERGQLFVKMMIIWSHQSVSMTSYDHPYIIYNRKMMIIRSHEVESLVTSYDHHFPKWWSQEEVVETDWWLLWSSFSQIAPFPCNFEQKFGVWGLYSIPHICQNHPRASAKKVIIGYLTWITNNPPHQIWDKPFYASCHQSSRCHDLHSIRHSPSRGEFSVETCASNSRLSAD